MAKQKSTISVKSVSINHSHRSHALLSPSSAKQWLSCPPSAVLKERFGGDKSSVYADEGTLAHELSELHLRKDVLGIISEPQFEGKLSELKSKDLFKPEMLDEIQLYTSYCRDTYLSEKSKNGSAIIEVETKLDMSKYVPGSFGTADCVVISNGEMEVIDLKYGKGVAVSAEHNEQLMMYGLGAYEFFNIMYPIHTVRMTIVQPRLDNISTYELPLTELLEWADQVLIPGAKKALSGEGDAVAGSWCKFCPIKPRCKAYNEYNTKDAIEKNFCDPRLLSDEEMAEILKVVPTVSEWAKAVQEYAEGEAVNNGKQWPGFKVVEGRSVRKWAISDEEELSEAIEKAFPTISVDEYTERKVICIGKFEKLVGKKVFKEKLADLTIKPQGAPTLVPETDKRPALDAAEDAARAFDGIEL